MQAGASQCREVVFVELQGMTVPASGEQLCACHEGILVQGRERQGGGVQRQNDGKKPMLILFDDSVRPMNLIRD